SLFFNQITQALKIKISILYPSKINELFSYNPIIKLVIFHLKTIYLKQRSIDLNSNFKKL
ncbi:hypothetical protein D0285_09135, partial [Campylobacter coli]|nr:hypothetical protein [Campylobacter coli]